MANHMGIDEQIARQKVLDMQATHREITNTTIAHSFGLNRLGIGGVETVDASGKITGITRVGYQWIANIGGWWSRRVIIAYTKFTKPENDSLQGVLLIKTHPSRMEFLGGNLLHSRSVGDHSDIVANALQQMNLFEPSIGIAPGNERTPEINMSIHIENGSRELAYLAGNIVDPSWLNLWDALYKTTKLLQAKYNDPEIDTILNRSPAGPPAEGLEGYLTR